MSKERVFRLRNDIVKMAGIDFIRAVDALVDIDNTTQTDEQRYENVCYMLGYGKDKEYILESLKRGTDLMDSNAAITDWEVKREVDLHMEELYELGVRVY